MGLGSLSILIRTCMCVRMCMCMCVRMRMCVCMCVCVYVCVMRRETLSHTLFASEERILAVILENYKLKNKGKFALKT